MLFPLREEMKRKQGGGISQNNLRRQSSPVLPLTSNDVSTGGKKRRKQRSRLMSLCFLLLQIIVLGVVVVMVQSLVFRRTVLRAGEDGPGGSGVFNRRTDEASKGGGALEKFTSLQYAFSNSQVVGLYFAAKWCPMSTPVTQLLDETFGDIITPPKNESGLQREGLSIVYVSSDRSEDDLKNYVRRNWWTVPWESKDRQDIKRHFQTCAKPEMEELGITERLREIPTLILISGETQDVLSYDGIKDIKEHGAQAIDRWMELAELSNALEKEDGKDS